MNVYTVLEERGFIHQVTDPALRELLGKEPITVYCGFDPTARSLHLGSLVPLLALAHFQRCGHRVIAVVGGATGMIGDPSGKSAERTLMSEQTIEENVEGLRHQMAHVLRYGDDTSLRVVNNYDWTRDFSYLAWLRDVGKHFSVNAMMAKDSIRARLEDREQGISYTEFSYMLLQAYDFLHLHEAHGCTLQIGGSDQWGNITAGIDLIRRHTGAHVHGITFPLLTTSSGQKFGKSEGNAIWIDGAMSPPWDMYQFWVRTEDADCERFLKLFTFLSLDEIAGIMARHSGAPEQRHAQKALALAATALIHGEGVAKSCAAGAAYLFSDEVTEADEAGILAALGDAPRMTLSRDQLAGGIALAEVLATGKLAASKGEARRLIKGGGVSINKVKVTDEARQLTTADLLTEHVSLVRAGKKNYLLVIVE